MKDFQRHPLSHLCGDMAPSTYIELAKDVSEVGVLEPVVLFEGQILDGWHRYRAWRDALALKADVQCAFDTFEGGVTEAAAFVRRKQIRRDWTASDRARAAVDLDEYVREKTGIGRSAADLAEDANVSPRTIVQARAVTRNAIPEVIEAVDAGALSLKQAAQIAQETPEAQPKALKKATTPKPRKVEPEGKWRSEVPLPRIGVTMDAHKEMEDRNATLVEEVDRLTDRCAVHFMEGTEEEKEAAASLIAELRQQVKVMEVEVQGLKNSRDSYQREASELRKQCAMYRNQLARKTA